jgi:hypothetical protein
MTEGEGPAGQNLGGEGGAGGSEGDHRTENESGHHEHADK